MKIFGTIIPIICRRRLYINRDGSYCNTGQLWMDDETGPYYVSPLVFEWIIFGIPLTRSHIYETATGQPVKLEIKGRIGE